MRKELKTTRDPISNYTTDKEKSLQDLVDAGYMRRIPTDPFYRFDDHMAGGDFQSRFDRSIRRSPASEASTVDPTAPVAMALRIAVGEKRIGDLEIAKSHAKFQ